MRDILIVLLFSAGAIMALRQPYVGILLWVWIGIMNPHRLTWGFAYSLPFAAAAAALTLVAMTYGKPRPRFPFNAPTTLLLLFVAWTGITTIFAIHVEPSTELFIKAFKTFFMTLLAVAIIQERKHIDALIWVIVASLCYFGVKGGLFTIATGGSYRVWGPPDSLIFGNNELAIALIMTVPLLYYLSQQTERIWFKRGLYLAMVLCSVAAIGSQSRGAFLAIIAMVGALSWKSKHKFRITVVLIALIPIFLTFMPESWWERMNTIRTYEEDTSAMGRIVAWKTAWNIASDRLTGAGFATSTRFIYDLYSPDPSAPVLVAHSIYFQVLGDHGFIGLFLYLILWLATYRLAGKLKKLTRDRDDLIWIRDLGRMIQVSFLGFFVGGAFLSLAYWDVPYYFLVIIVALERLARQPPETVAPPLAADASAEPAHVNIPPQLSRRP